MPQTRKLVGALGVVFGLAVLAFAISAGGAHQAFGQTPATTGTSAAGTGTTTSGTSTSGTPAAGTTGTSAAGTPAAAGTSITTTGTKTAGSPTAGAAAGASTLPSSGTGDDGGSSSMLWLVAAGALVALFGAGVLASGIRKHR